MPSAYVDEVRESNVLSVLEVILYLNYIAPSIAGYVNNLRNGTLGRVQHTWELSLVPHALRERIEDLRKQIELMSDQLSRKDDQITQLNEATQKQAVHIQSLIQENSKLNMKLLPENTENKPWWMFWRRG